MLGIERHQLRHHTASLPVRAALGASMLYHGVSKLKGEGPKKTGQMMHQLGFERGEEWAKAAGIAEAFAGASALLGVLTRPAALAVLATQAVAIAKVHAKNGYDMTKGGFEYNLALMGIALFMLIDGPGRFSLHEAIERGVEGSGLRRLRQHVRPNLLVRAIHALQ
jgi:putative oxidoreductase